MAPPPEAEPNPLIALFRRCVVCVTDEAGVRGSGFFVVLTCRHVVHGAVALRV